jgi:hypothetical protein
MLLPCVALPWPPLCPLGSRVRAAYHPAAFESSLARHVEEATSSAAVLSLEIRDGKYDPSGPTFDQGQLKPGEAGEGEEGSAAAVAPVGPPPEGPVGLWRPERVAHDYKVAKRLVCVVDQQRGLQLADNPLLPSLPTSSAAAAADGEGADGEAVKGTCACRAAYRAAHATLLCPPPLTALPLTAVAPA